MRPYKSLLDLSYSSTVMFCCCRQGTTQFYGQPALLCSLIGEVPVLDAPDFNKGAMSNDPAKLAHFTGLCTYVILCVW